MSRSNSKQYAIQSLKVSTREQTWEINYAYQVLMSMICKKHGYDDSYHSKEASPYSACQYQRSQDLCRKHLLLKKLITPENTPVMEMVEQTAVQYAEAPEFNTYGYITKNSYSSPEPYEVLEDAYQDLTRLSHRELLSVAVNQKEYDIYVFRKIQRDTFSSYGGRRSRRYNYSPTPAQEREIVSLKIYPKALRQKLLDNVCMAKMNSFLRHDRKSIFSHFLLRLLFKYSSQDMSRE